MYSLQGKYKRALVTGGAGFIGSHIIDSLLRDGIEVVSIDNYSAGKTENLEWAKTQPGFTEVNCDIREYETLLPNMSEVDVVFHNAVSKMTICLKDPRMDLATNALGTFNVLEAARVSGVKKFVHASTGSVYGEAQYFPTDEKHQLYPVSYYGVSKLAAERYVGVFHKMHGMDVSILRYYHVFGPRQDASDVGGVVSIFGRRALQNLPVIIYGDGTQVRSFTFVDDVVNINKFVAGTSSANGEAFNCASGIQVSIKDLAKEILQEFQKTDLEIQHQDWKKGDILNFDVSHEKLSSMGFQFSVPYKQGLCKTLQYLESLYGDSQKMGASGEVTTIQENL